MQKANHSPRNEATSMRSVQMASFPRCSFSIPPIYPNSPIIANALQQFAVPQWETERRRPMPKPEEKPKPGKPDVEPLDGGHGNPPPPPPPPPPKNDEPIP